MSAKDAKPGPTRWPRQSLLDAMNRWTILYGSYPAQRDWNRSSARQSSCQIRYRRLMAGLWPDYRTVLREFGSWEKAVAAARRSRRRKRLPIRSSSRLPGATR